VVVGDAKAANQPCSTRFSAANSSRRMQLRDPERIHLIKYGEEERDVAIGDDLIECRRHASFLRDFNIVDTPGVNLLRRVIRRLPASSFRAPISCSSFLVR
jgi:hypothetical protein